MTKFPIYGKWLEESGNDNAIVLTSRVRLARNLANWKFPYFTSSAERKAIFEQVSNAMADNDFFGNDYQSLDLSGISALKRQYLFENSFISKEMMADDNKGLIYSWDKNYYIMVNEEDHIRIQVINPGLSLQQTYKLADQVDDELEKKLAYAFSEDWGYLTTCPTNAGTGMRASVMVHLPALVHTQRIKKILKAMGLLNIAVRGFLGEGTENLGDFFQVSNQVTLGQSEPDIVDNMQQVSLQLMAQERACRKDLLARNKLRVKDMVHRSLGILKYCQVLDFNEAVSHLSNIFLGVAENMIHSVRLIELRKLLVTLQQAHIKLHSTEDITEDSEENIAARDHLRANMLRDFFLKGEAV